MDNLDTLFYPQSVAVIGVSESPQKWAYYPIKHLVDGGFSGGIYPVNPRLSHIFGLKVYPSIEAIPAEVDIAIIVVSAHLVPSVLKECAQKGIRGAVILSGGFEESGMESGAKLQEEIMAIADRAKIKIIGPNSVGIGNPYANFNATLESSFIDACRGNIAIVSQSGGVCAFLLNSMINQNLGISMVMSLGNRWNVDFADLVEYLGKHQQTKVITLYIEGLDNPHKLIEAAKGVVPQKPIVAYKVRGESLNRAAYAHTASLVGRYEVYNAAFSQAGIIAVDDLTELIDVAKALAFQSPPRGNRVAILSGQAGPGIVAATACQHYGLTLAEFSPQGKKKLGKLVGTPFFSENPFDMGAAFVKDTTQIFQQVLEILQREEEVDAIVVSCVYHPLNTPLIESLINLAEDKAVTKTIVAFGSSPKGIADQQIARLENNHIPVYPLPDRAVKALAGLVRYGKVRYLTS